MEAALGPSVVANRVLAASARPPLLVLEPWREARRRFRATAGAAAAAGALLITDVRDCYGSIEPAVVGESLGSLGASDPLVRGIVAMLRHLARLGVRGLPVGPPASAVLANAVLSSVDAALTARSVGYARWVDDMWIGAPDVDSARDLLDVVIGGLARLGLEVAGAKTRVIAGSEVVRAMREGRVSAAGYHRPAHAHPVPGIDGPHAVAPAVG